MTIDPSGQHSAISANSAAAASDADNTALRHHYQQQQQQPVVTNALAGEEWLRRISRSQSLDAIGTTPH